MKPSRYTYMVADSKARNSRMCSTLNHVSAQLRAYQSHVVRSESCTNRMQPTCSEARTNGTKPIVKHVTCTWLPTVTTYYILLDMNHAKSPFLTGYSISKSPTSYCYINNPIVTTLLLSDMRLLVY